MSSNVVNLDDPSSRLKLLPVKINAEKVRPLGSGKWLKLEQVDYTEPKENTNRQWEVCRRKKSTSLAEQVDAVDVRAIIRSPDSPPIIILVVQYRPAVGKYCVEFPSGLIDEGETESAAALRELREETGYTGHVKGISQSVSYEPGMTDSMTKIVHVEVDPTLTENIRPSQQLDEDEWSMQVFTVSLDNLFSVLQDLPQQYENLCVDSRLYAFALGLHVGKNEI